MRKLLKKKINILGKEISVVLVGLLAVVMVSAALLGYYGQIEQTVIIGGAAAFSGTGCVDGLCTENLGTINACESTTSEIYTIESLTGVVIPLDILTSIAPPEVDIDMTIEYVLSATGTQGTESRIFINAEDLIGIDSLNDLTSIEWESYVEDGGYIAHVDVIIDTDGDGMRDDALVFEYDKVDSPSDQTVPNMNFARDTWVNTFDNKGFVDSDAIGWLTSEDAGPVGGVNFTAYSLNNWKSGQTSNRYSKNIPADVSVIGFEIEVDNWIVDTDAKVRNIQINGNPIEISLLPSDELSFDVFTEVDCLIDTQGSYLLTTTVTARTV